MIKIKGKVISGAKQAGTQFGVETANLDVSKPDIEDGVYAAYTYYQGNKIPSIIFKGKAHLLEGQPRHCEVHLLEGKYDLYGESLEVEFINKIRDTIVFTDTEQARYQIHKDLEKVKQYFK